MYSKARWRPQKSFWKFVGIVALITIGMWLLAVVGLVMVGVLS